MASPGQTEEQFWITENHEATFVIAQVNQLRKERWRIDLALNVESEDGNDYPIEYSRFVFSENLIAEEKAILIELAKSEIKRRGMI
jgi:hypothetical protein